MGALGLAGEGVAHNPSTLNTYLCPYLAWQVVVNYPVAPGPPGRSSGALVASSYKRRIDLAGMAVRPIVAGVPAPDFELPSLTGGSVRLSDYMGRKVVLFMWASW